MKAEEVFNSSRKDLINRGISDLLIGIENLYDFPKSSENHNVKNIQTLQTTFNLPNGRSYFFDIKIFPIIEGTILIISDQTEINEIKRKLSDSEEIYKIITEQSFMGIAILHNNSFLYINKRYADIFGYSIEELMKWPLENFSNLIHPEDRDFVIEQGRKKQMGSTNVLNQYQYRGIRKSGDTTWLDFFSKPISLGGKTANLIMVIDITEKKTNKEAMQKLIEEIQNQNEKLKKIDKEKDEMLEIISHELRTPLVSILGFCELFSNECANLTPSQMQHLEIISRNAQRLNRLVDQILGKNRLELGEIQLKVETFDVNTLINQVIGELNFQISQKLHNIRVNIPPNFKIQADREHIHQVILNLLSNAIKYTPNLGTILIDIKKHGLSAIFSIKDNGIGLAKEELPLLFEKFSRLNQVHNKLIGDVRGIGLGLYISKKIIELHNGKIWAESEGKNKGTSFYFEIPLQY